jgi:hypothetical protein
MKYLASLALMLIALAANAQAAGPFAVPSTAGCTPTPTVPCPIPPMPAGVDRCVIYVNANPPLIGPCRFDMGALPAGPNSVNMTYLTADPWAKESPKMAVPFSFPVPAVPNSVPGVQLVK